MMTPGLFDRRSGRSPEHITNACLVVGVHRGTGLGCMLAKGHPGRHLARVGELVTPFPPIYEWDGPMADAVLVSGHRLSEDGLPVVLPESWGTR
jgi:hypothetical protein